MELGDGRVSIRAMRETDLDRVMAIADSVGTAPDWTREAYIAAIGVEGSPARVALVAEVQTENGAGVVGFAVASLGLQAELESIAVAGAMQGQGIGSALLDGVVGAAERAGAMEMMLEVRASNGRAARLYAAAGFVEVGRRRGYYANPAEDACVLRLGLGLAG